MHAPANQPDFKAAESDAKPSGSDPAPTPDPVIDELNHVINQAEALLRSLGAQTGDAAEAVRERVNETLQQARARLAATANEAEEAAITLVDRTDDYVRRNPWQAVTIAALLGGVVAYLLARTVRKK
jgi:ElaB/YqjD/DUF883 family membrane-anchored ribosome-binding protein